MHGVACLGSPVGDPLSSVSCVEVLSGRSLWGGTLWVSPVWRVPCGVPLLWGHSGGPIWGVTCEGHMWESAVAVPP